MCQKIEVLDVKEGLLGFLLYANYLWNRHSVTVQMIANEQYLHFKKLGSLFIGT